MVDELIPLSNSNASKSKVQLKLKTDEITLLRESWTATSTNNRGKGKPTQLMSSKSASIESTSAMFGSTHFWVKVYEDLIAKHPVILDYLPSIKHQTVQFASIMLMAVENLEDLSNMSLFLQKLGCMHVRMFCVEPAYFQMMGESLHDVLIERMPDLKVVDLWMKVYCFLANSMMTAADVKVLNEHLVTVPTQVTFFDEEAEAKALANHNNNSHSNGLSKITERDSKIMSKSLHRRTTLTVDSTDASSINSASTSNTVVSSDWSSNEHLAKINTQAPAPPPKMSMANPSSTQPPSPTQGVPVQKNVKPSRGLGRRLFGRALSNRDSKPLLSVGMMH
ncbi:unnamed protein product [Ambrosiozyma monospora]|uniref:Unnamed protein product n=1 Tax=Ambrosiozyma monospora TaxID=43982 RepID=A0A9W6YYZ6_AMBMO|nr:unnamed protein product [Ambrosiozyma monospora]